MTRGIYDPVHPWLNAKVASWVRFLGVDPAGWKVEQAGGTGWISKRPFSDLKGLEKHLPRPPVFDEVAAWFKPFSRRSSKSPTRTIWPGCKASKGRCPTPISTPTWNCS